MIDAIQIVDDAAAKGVVLALDPSGRMIFYGTLPADWTDLSKAWLADRVTDFFFATRVGGGFTARRSNLPKIKWPVWPRLGGVCPCDCA